MALALDNFIDNSGGSSIDVTNISLNTNPVASSQFNTGGNGITVNAVVTPENPTNPALTWAVSGSGFVITPASDTQSAVVTSASTAGTRTVTATTAGGGSAAGSMTVLAVTPTLETVADTISVYGGRGTVLNITANDTTLGGGCTVVIDDDPSVGELAVSGENVTYTAPDVQTQQITFTYHLTKSGFSASNISTVTLFITQN
tara:strand:+ start:366 stop:971 length:606 start_codon:yes stop_codon:yes gene_type:complete